MTIPDETGRLFAHYPAPDLGTEAGRTFAALRLSEEGDRGELRWLVTEIGEKELRRTLTRYAERQLSRRSRAFWRRVLDLPTARAAAAGAGEAAELWPR